MKITKDYKLGEEGMLENTAASAEGGVCAHNS